MDFRKLGQQVGRLRETTREKVGDRAEPDNLKRDGKELREILAGDGSLAEKAREAKEKLYRIRISDQPAPSKQTPEREGSVPTVAVRRGTEALKPPGGSVRAVGGVRRGA